MPGERTRCNAGSAPPCECRCACGSLLARLVEGAVELKCRRCKRTLVLPLAGRLSPGSARRARSLPFGAAG